MTYIGIRTTENLPAASRIHTKTFSHSEMNAGRKIDYWEVWIKDESELAAEREEKLDKKFIAEANKLYKNKKE